MSFGAGRRGHRLRPGAFSGGSDGGDDGSVRHVYESRRLPGLERHPARSPARTIVSWRKGRADPTTAPGRTHRAGADRLRVFDGRNLLAAERGRGLTASRSTCITPPDFGSI